MEVWKHLQCCEACSAVSSPFYRQRQGHYLVCIIPMLCALAREERWKTPSGVCQPHSHTLGEMPLLARTKAAALLSLLISKKGLGTPIDLDRWCRWVRTWSNIHRIAWNCKPEITLKLMLNRGQPNHVLVKKPCRVSHVYQHSVPLQWRCQCQQPASPGSSSPIPPPHTARAVNP